MAVAIILSHVHLWQLSSRAVMVSVDVFEYLIGLLLRGSSCLISTEWCVLVRLHMHVVLNARHLNSSKTRHGIFK